MILIDSSVWISVFRSPKSEVALAVERIAGDDAATCGIVMQEVLQGVRPPHYVEAVRQSLSRHYYLETPPEVYVKAADYMRRCRSHGISLPTVDALIGAIASHHGARLWSLDDDFVRAARVLPIRLYQIP